MGCDGAVEEEWRRGAVGASVVRMCCDGLPRRMFIMRSGVRVVQQQVVER